MSQQNLILDCSRASVERMLKHTHTVKRSKLNLKHPFKNEECNKVFFMTLDELCYLKFVHCIVCERRVDTKNVTHIPFICSKCT